MNRIRPTATRSAGAQVAPVWLMSCIGRLADSHRSGGKSGLLAQTVALAIRNDSGQPKAEKHPGAESQLSGMNAPHRKLDESGYDYGPVVVNLSCASERQEQQRSNQNENRQQESRSNNHTHASTDFNQCAVYGLHPPFVQAP